MKKSNKFLSIFCVMCMMLSLAAPALAVETPLIDDGTRLPTPRASQVVVEQSINSIGASWKQPLGNYSYKIWVENTTDQTMTITHKSGLKNDTYTVAANTNKVILVVNDAIPFATHSLDFSTTNGILSGRVTVRVSDVDQSY